MPARRRFSLSLKPPLYQSALSQPALIEYALILAVWNQAARI